MSHAATEPVFCLLGWDERRNLFPPRLAASVCLWSVSPSSYVSEIHMAIRDELPISTRVGTVSTLEKMDEAMARLYPPPSQRDREDDVVP